MSDGLGKGLESCPLQICVLASGSAGNCAVVRAPGGVLAIDAGIGPRSASLRLKGTGVSVADLSAICLTHLDRDHFRTSWVTTIVRQGIRVFCHVNRVNDLLRIVRQEFSAPDDADDLRSRIARFQALIQPFDNGFDPLPDVSATAVGLSHDDTGSHGFILSCRGMRIGYATDLGHVPARLIDSFEDLDVLALESNYDPKMQVESQRPLFLKRRIMGGRGHLSNVQAFEAIRTVLDRCQRRGRRLPAHVLLLHRSRDCNCPDLVREFFSRDPRIVPRLILAEQFEPSGWLGRVRRETLAGEQLIFSW